MAAGEQHADFHCPVDSLGAGEKTGITLLDLSDVDRMGKNAVTDRTQTVSSNAQPCHGLLMNDIYTDSARSGRDNPIKVADQDPSADNRTVAQKFKDIEDGVRNDMRLLEDDIKPEGIESDTDVFKKYAPDIVRVIDQGDEQMVHDWTKYHDIYLQIKDKLVAPKEQMEKIVEDARKLVDALPEDKREDVTSTLQEIARFPDNDSDATKFWSGRLPKDGEWASIQQRLANADSVTVSLGPVGVYRHMYTQIQAEVKLMRDMRSYSQTFLSVAGREQDAEQSEKQMELLQFTFDNFPTSKMLESPTLKLRDFDQDGTPETDFWKK